MKKKTLFVNNSHFNYINTIKEYKSSFGKYSELMDIEYLDVKNNLRILTEKLKTEHWDIIIFFYDIDFRSLNKVSIDIKNLIRNFFTICIWQDEYHCQKIKSQIIEDFDINLTFVNVSEKDAVIIFNNTKSIFKNVLTGYVPDIKYERIPISARKTNIFYRSTPLHYIYGDLGQQKTNIGKKIKAYAQNSEIITDIEWEYNKKIFKEEWYIKLLNSKVTLATECGCKVFDFEPRLTKINAILKTNPNYTYEQAKKDFNIIPMYEACQVSPKMFEAAKLGTVLIMFEGEYKNIFKANIHYIELKKDYSNLDEVLEKVKDDVFLQNMADRTYKDIVESGKYSYKKFIEFVDSIIKEQLNISGYL